MVSSDSYVNKIKWTEESRRKQAGSISLSSVAPCRRPSEKWLCLQGTGQWRRKVNGCEGSLLMGPCCLKWSRVTVHLFCLSLISVTQTLLFWNFCITKHSLVVSYVICRLELLFIHSMPSQLPIQHFEKYCVLFGKVLKCELWSD